MTNRYASTGTPASATKAGKVPASDVKQDGSSQVKSTDTTPNTGTKPKAGSMMAKANMVKQYNERNNNNSK